jgi:hypothetical protein
MGTATMDEPADRASGRLRTLVFLAFWFFGAIGLGISGALATSGPPLLLAATIATPLLLFAADGRFGHPLFGGLTALGLSALVAAQTYRVVGAVFVVAAADGALPAGFALPAGLGDVAVGMAAPFVAAAIVAGKPYARRLAVAWNLFGLADLIVAVTLGLAHSSSALGFLASSPTTDAVARYPLSLVPTFLVPISIILHVLALRRARSAPARP